MAVRMVRVTPVITAGGYTNGDSIGGVIRMADAPIQGTIQTITINDAGDQGSAVQLLFFRSEPVGAIDNAAILTLIDADSRLLLNIIAEDTWIDNVDNQFAFHNNVSMGYEHEGRGLYLIIRLNDGSTPTYNAIDDLQLQFGIVY